MIDLIASIYAGKLTIDDAYKLWDGFFDGKNKGENTTWVNYFGFSDYEATAHASALDFDYICKLRYEGWPTKCHRCKKDLNYKNYGWKVIEDEHKEKQLVHIVCPKS